MIRSAPRTPETAAPRRIEPLSVMPVFLRLEGRPVLLAGGSEGAAWKAELLAAAGALVRVAAAEPCALMEDIAAAPAAGSITLLGREWQTGDFAGAAIAVADVESDDEAARFAAAAKAAGVPVNVVDKPVFCEFQFGAIVNRSPLVISISTDGAAPVFGQAIRTRIEALLPTGFRRWAQAAKDWRPAVQARELSFAARRAFWEAFTRIALDHPNREPTETDRSAAFAAVEHGAQTSGRVTLVGAGPGDPELLTLKAVRALQSADIILHDDLVSPEVLDLARREARRMVVGKRGHGPSCTQSDINELMVGLARQGRHVVRLKSGDPMVFGRAGEELAACRAAGIAATVVPGVSAAQGAAASLQVSLTHRDLARRVQFVTGHASDGRLPADIDWAAMADPAATTAIYMGKKTLAQFAAAAQAAGLPADTPATAVAWVSTPREQVVHATVTDMAERLGDLDPHAPVVVLVGRVLADAVARAAALGEDAADAARAA
jgi:uroporphyrin-III C-methyltransferase/precorrin-2 dehydrogenase/sirohydrochlorin ferrochelatase